MKRVRFVAIAVFAIAGAGVAFSEEGNRRFSEFLSGLKEAPAIVSTTANGTFRATISRDGDEINYALAFRDLEGPVTQAHIHIGHPQNSGGIVLWLCETTGTQSPVDSTPDCLANSDAGDTRNGWVTGTLTEADVINLAGNGIAGLVVPPATGTTTSPGEFAEVVRLIRAGSTYVNVHSGKFGAGEIRSQLDNRDRDDDRSGHGGRDH